MIAVSLMALNVSSLLANFLTKLNAYTVGKIYRGVSTKAIIRSSDCKEPILTLKLANPLLHKTHAVDAILIY